MSDSFSVTHQLLIPLDQLIFGLKVLCLLVSENTLIADSSKKFESEIKSEIKSENKSEIKFENKSEIKSENNHTSSVTKSDHRFNSTNQLFHTGSFFSHSLLTNDSVSIFLLAINNYVNAATDYDELCGMMEQTNAQVWFLFQNEQI